MLVTMRRRHDQRRVAGRAVLAREQHDELLVTTAIEDMVSHGYAVAAVEHPYIAAAVAFSSGAVAVYIDRSSRPSGVSYFEGVELAMREMRQSAAIAAADLTFALDQLAALNSSKSFLLNGRLDLHRVAAVGHSLGGQAAVRTCQTDTRVKACADLDGGTPDGVFLHYPDARPLKQPLLYVEATPAPTLTDRQLADRGISRADWVTNLRRVADTQEQQLRSGLGGTYKVVLDARGMNHFSFTDVSLNAATADAEKQALHNVKLTTEVTRAFLDITLEGKQSSMLDTKTAVDRDARDAIRASPSIAGVEFHSTRSVIHLKCYGRHARPDGRGAVKKDLSTRFLPAARYTQGAFLSPACLWVVARPPSSPHLSERASLSDDRTGPRWFTAMTKGLNAPSLVSASRLLVFMTAPRTSAMPTCWQRFSNGDLCTELAGVRVVSRRVRSDLVETRAHSAELIWASRCLSTKLVISRRLCATGPQVF